MALTFAEKLLIEQIRAMEEAFTISIANEQPHHNSADIEQVLLRRAQSLSLRYNLQNVLTHAAKLSRHISLALIALAAIGGILAVLQAMATTQQTLNIYWLIIVLLGANTISLVLWLLATLLLRSANAGHSILRTLWHWLEPHITSNKPQQAAADQSWLLTVHHGKAGRWWLAGLSHSLWLSYLSAALLILLLLLMSKQFDFIWATTILSDDVFLSLTQTMATPLNALGLQTPTAEQIDISRLGADSHNGAELRRAWAMFLLGSLVVYGILPRALLLTACVVFRWSAQNQFQLDYTLPYYIKLERQLMPTSVPGVIIDPDIELKPADAESNTDLQSEALPGNACWVALELAQGTHWPIAEAKHNAGHVTDTTSLTSVLNTLKHNRDPLAVAVSLERSPDRGIKRLLQQLFETTTGAKRWLVIIDNAQLNKKLTKQRLSEWIAMAKRCGMIAEHVSLFKTN